ncbi:FG-GAP repeat protein [Vibrio mimicus]|uniref:FG-GAP repeat protein n=1 Tax=Vibrio mimicus TaxID=674 RepID=UPI002FF17E87
MSKRIILTMTLLSLFLLGCGQGGEEKNDGSGNGNGGGTISPVLSSFNLSSINRSVDIAKALTFTWTSASNVSGVRYTVCELNIGKEHNCKALGSVVDALSLTVLVENVVASLSKDYFILANKESEEKSSSELNLSLDTVNHMIEYFKPSNTGADDNFGVSLALSGDNKTLVVGAYYEDNGAKGVISDGSEITDVSTAVDSGAVYVFTRNNRGKWSQSSYLKASNTGAEDNFGTSLALSEDGKTLVVGASAEDNGFKGIIIDGSEVTDSGTAVDSGAVYVFTKSNTGTWSQSAYIKASNTGASDLFGNSVAISKDGKTLAVGAPTEDNAAKGIIINGSETIDVGTENNSGAVYLFTQSDSGEWSQIAYFKASNTGASDLFGSAITLSDNGKMLVVGAYNEDNGAKGIIINGSEVMDLGTATNSGAVYVFIKDSSGSWAQSAYIKASNTGADDNFGASLAASEDGNTLTVGAWFEDNSVTGVVVDGSEITDLSTINNAGAVYVFTKDNAGVWSQSAYVKGSNTGSGDSFGTSLSVSDNGKTLAVGATGESNSAKGIIINGSEIIDVGSVTSAGAVYLFIKDSSGSWSQIAYLKASNTDMIDYFGKSLALSGNGNVIAVGAHREDNKVSGVIIDGSEIIDSGTENDSGAVYLY